MGSLVVTMRTFVASFRILVLTLQSCFRLADTHVYLLTGAGDWNRTSGLMLRRHPLYPSELRQRIGGTVGDRTQADWLKARCSTLELQPLILVRPVGVEPTTCRLRAWWAARESNSALRIKSPLLRRQSLQPLTVGGGTES